MTALDGKRSDKLLKLFGNAVETANMALPAESQVQSAEHLILVGGRDPIESLALINIILEFERLLVAEFGRAPNLFDSLNSSEPDTLTVKGFLGLVRENI